MLAHSYHQVTIANGIDLGQTIVTNNNVSSSSSYNYLKRKVKRLTLLFMHTPHKFSLPYAWKKSKSLLSCYIFLQIKIIKDCTTLLHGLCVLCVSGIFSWFSWINQLNLFFEKKNKASFLTNFFCVSLH